MQPRSGQGQTCHVVMLIEGSTRLSILVGILEKKDFLVFLFILGHLQFLFAQSTRAREQHVPHPFV